MTDTTITKIDSTHSPKGGAGQKYLACGTVMSMRLWENEKPKKDQTDTKRDYETVGYVLKGKAELHCEGQTVLLNPGDSWVVPKGASHHYTILEEFSALESTSPPAELHDRGSDDSNYSAKEFFEVGAHDAEAVKEVAPAKGASTGTKAMAKTESKDEVNKAPSPGTGSDGKPAAESKETEKEMAKTKPENPQPAEGKAASQPAAKCEQKEGEKCEHKQTVKQSDDDSKENKAEKEESEGEGDGETCDPSKHECAPGQDDGKEGKKGEDEKEGKQADSKPSEENAPENKASENKAEDLQKIAAEIPRTDSEPTSNSPKKEPKPAEHIDMNAAQADEITQAKKAMQVKEPMQVKEKMQVKEPMQANETKEEPQQPDGQSKEEPAEHDTASDAGGAGENKEP